MTVDDRSLCWRVARELDEGTLPIALAVEWSHRGTEAWRMTGYASDLCVLLSACNRRLAVLAGVACVRHVLRLAREDDAPTLQQSLDVAERWSRGAATDEDRALAMHAIEDVWVAQEGESRWAISSAWGACSRMPSTAAREAVKAMVCASVRATPLVSEFHLRRAAERELADIVRAAVPCPTTAILLGNAA